MLNIKKFNVRLSALFVSAVVLFVTVFSLSSSKADAGDITRKYKVYNATTGSYLREYSLTVEGINTRSVIPPDDREIDYSKNGVVKLIIQNLTTGRQTFGSGFVVDDHTIATAAHCVNGYKIKSILFFDQNGNVSMNITDPVEYHLPDKFIQNTSLYAYDYALITVKQSLEDYRCFDFGMMTEDFISKTNNVVSIAGFPEMVHGEKVNTTTTHVEYRSTGHVVDKKYGDSGNIERIFHNADSTGGNSGGPMYVSEQFDGNLYCTVIGIHAYSDGNNPPTQNSGTAMSPAVLKFLKGNSNKNY